MVEGTPENRKGGWVTSTTPSRRRKPEKHFKLFSLSPANVENSLENGKLFVSTEHDGREDHGDDGAGEDDAESIRDRHEADTGQAGDGGDGSY